MKIAVFLISVMILDATWALINIVKGNIGIAIWMAILTFAMYWCITHSPKEDVVAAKEFFKAPFIGIFEWLKK